jgi:hypothetical protein
LTAVASSGKRLGHPCPQASGWHISHQFHLKTTPGMRFSFSVSANVVADLLQSRYNLCSFNLTFRITRTADPTLSALKSAPWAKNHETPLSKLPPKWMP